MTDTQFEIVVGTYFRQLVRFVCKMHWIASDLL